MCVYCGIMGLFCVHQVICWFHCRFHGMDSGRDHWYFSRSKVCSIPIPLVLIHCQDLASHCQALVAILLLKVADAAKA